MKYCRCLVPAAVAISAFAAPPQAHAQSISTTVFDAVVVISTDTFESEAGVPIFTDNAVGFSDNLTPDIATDIETDPAFPAEAQAAAGYVPQISDYQFLTGPGSSYVVFNGSASLASIPDITVPQPYLDAEGGQNSYSVVSSPSTSVGIYSYSTGAFTPSNDLIEGTVDFDVYDNNTVFRADPAAPEPSSFTLLSIGLIPLILRARRLIRS